jgi:DNA-directed RNA polymerase specialized sigma24 family protein
MSDDDVGVWIEGLRHGDPGAAQQVWERYFARLVGLAQRRMAGMPRRAVDEEDVALSALNSFIAGARAAKFPQLEDESDLWRLLVTITARKAGAQRRHHFAARRSGGKVRGESAFENVANVKGSEGIGAAVGKEPTPQFAAQVAEQCQILFNKLDDPLLRDIALWKMEGSSNDEIAEKIGCNVRTVERKLNLIRSCWSTAD